MTIGAISSVYTYSTSYQSSIFGSTYSNERLNQLMRQYGIIQTGDEYTDLVALYNAMHGDAKTKIEAAAAQKAGQNEPISTNTSKVPWQSLMAQVGLQTTGNVSVDYEAFNRRLFQMQGAARSKQDEADIYALMNQGNIVFNDQTQQNDITASGATKPQAISGAEILAQMNKMFALY